MKEHTYVGRRIRWHNVGRRITWHNIKKIYCRDCFRRKHSTKFWRLHNKFDIEMNELLGTKSRTRRR